MKTSISLNDLIDCIAKLVQENNLDFHVSYPEKAYAWDKGQELWKINLGTKDHPFWIYGSKEKVFEEYQKFNKQMRECANNETKRPESEDTRYDCKTNQQ